MLQVDRTLFVCGGWGHNRLVLSSRDAELQRPLFFHQDLQSAVKIEMMVVNSANHRTLSESVGLETL